MNKRKITVPLESKQSFISILSNINHEISYHLLELINYKNHSPISFLDVGKNKDAVSYVNANKVRELMDKYGDDFKIKAWYENRYENGKIGKAIRLIFGNHFPINIPKGENTPKPPNDIESFVNMYKAEREKNNNYDKFELVKGEDIRYWYNQKNYSRFLQPGTPLAKSCLRHPETAKFLDIYVDNPDIVSMLILKDNEDRLRARALIWNLEKPEGRIYMDRVYFTNDFDIELFKNYAKNEGWLFKSKQTYGYEHAVIDSRDEKDYYWQNFKMMVTFKKKTYKYFPYIDTMSVFNKDTFTISNNGNLLSEYPYVKLSDPGGGFIDQTENDYSVFSTIYNERIQRNESVFVEIDNSWVYESDAVYVHNTGGQYAHINSPKILKSQINEKVKYFLKDVCIYSKLHGTYIYKGSSIKGFYNKDKKNVIISHKKLMKDYFIKDEVGDLILKEELQEKYKFLCLKLEKGKYKQDNPPIQSQENIIRPNFGSSLDPLFDINDEENEPRMIEQDDRTDALSFDDLDNFSTINNTPLSELFRRYTNLDND